MKNLIKILGLTVIVAVTLFACNEDFLVKNAQGDLDATALANQNGLEGNLISAYSMLEGYGNFGGWGTAGSNWTFGSVAGDEAYKGSSAGDQQFIQDVELYQWATADVDVAVNERWQSVYEGVARANATLNLLKTVTVSDADAKRIEGEAKALRAHYHFEAWRLWRNIPYYKEDDTDFRKPNLGTDAIPLILGDLDEAIGLLPESQAQVGRITKWTAKAIKGRVQVLSGDYAGGKTTLAEVVNSGPYDLEANFHKVFQNQNENGKETVLAFQASTNDGTGGGENGNYPDRLNFPHSGSPFGCCGFHQPSQNMVNSYKVDANGLPFLDGSFNNADLVATDAVDPRLDWTVGRDGVPFLDWGVHDPGWIRERAWAGPYSHKKTIYEKASGAGSAVGWSQFQLSANNLHLLRFADVVLLLAECEIQVGSIDAGMVLINRIRTRAGQGAQGPAGGAVVVPINDPGITWATYKIGTYPTTGWSKEDAMKALKMERKLELSAEGHRYFDLVRWGDFKTHLNAYLAVEKTKRIYLTAAAAVEDKHALYPIPSAQIDLSEIATGDGTEQRLVQNPGW
jgi:starch-binding outer membrane protein, SusD/RagB family